MRQRIIYLLKHNKWIQKIYRVVFSALFQCLGFFIPTDRNLVLLNSMMGTRFNDSPKAIYDYLMSHEKYAHLKLVWVFEHPENYPDVVSVKIDTPRFFFLALRAGYWVSNTQFERGLHFKKKATVYVYTCHGTAIKLCGNSCPGRNDFDYSGVNKFCVSSEYDKMVLRKSFKARDESFVECGWPSSDNLWAATPDICRDMRVKMGLPLNKKIILYAPTWRDSQDAGKTYALVPPVDFKKWRKHLGDEYMVLFRAHHITTKVMNIAFDDFVWDVSDYPEINDLMLVADILISDYSAVLTDFSILERPILCFAYDYEQYLQERGTYFDLDEELPSKSCRTEEELLARILSLDEEKERLASKRFKEKFAQFGGNATETIVREAFGS